MAHSEEEIRAQVKVYLIIYGFLMVLTGLTVAISWLNLTTGMAIFVALVVASVKGSLVAAYFMHLLNEKSVIYWSLGLTVILFAFLMFLPLITGLDKIQGV